jgi:hypothetical protein
MLELVMASFGSVHTSFSGGVTSTNTPLESTLLQSCVGASFAGR